MKQISPNAATIRTWVSQHKAVAKIPTTLSVGPKGQVAWIITRALDSAKFVSGLPYPVPYISSMPSQTLRSLGHSISSEPQLAVIRQYNTHGDAIIRDLCTGWAATIDGQTNQIRWRTTDNVQRWLRFSKLQPELLCATVVEPLADLGHWGVLNVLCVLIPKLALIKIETYVIIPQTKAVLYHLSKEVRAAVFSIHCNPASWKNIT